MVKILRTGNAGVLLEMDGQKLLLDGVSREVPPYSSTPAALLETIWQSAPDMLAFTHTHEDHYDPDFLHQYRNHFAGPVMGPAEIPFSTRQPVQTGTVKVEAVDSRHIGKTAPISHKSYLIRGSRCVWFMGDAAPLQPKDYAAYPRPDVLIVPYGFVIGRGWQLCQALQPEYVVILHLPEREKDIYGLYEGVEKAIQNTQKPQPILPRMGQWITLL